MKGFGRRPIATVREKGYRSAPLLSTFADWAAEQTDFPREVREMALAHAVGDRVEAAYRRGDLFEKRRQLAEEWAGFCASGPAGPPQMAFHAVR